MDQHTLDDEAVVTARVPIDTQTVAPANIAIASVVKSGRQCRAAS